jgi:ribonuclease HII
VNEQYGPGRYFVGVDENGLGPRLGPLIVTGVLAEVTDGSAAARIEDPSAWPAGCGDSKRLSSFHDSRLGEAWARIILGERGVPCDTPRRLIARLSLDNEAFLKAPCPHLHAAQCWGTAEETFTSGDGAVDSAPLAVATRAWSELERLGIRVRDVRSVVVCTRRLNDALAIGKSRFDVDLECMERLVCAFRSLVDEEVNATCGKVGGIDRYASRFETLPTTGLDVLREGRGESAYRVRGLGSVRFVRDADASHLLVALSSLVGKWARDVFMRRIGLYHLGDGASRALPSGYHDPVTTRFVEATALRRRERGLPDTCFERLTSHEAAAAARIAQVPPSRSSSALLPLERASTPMLSRFVDAPPSQPS